MSLISILIVILIIGGVAYLIKLAPIGDIWKNVCYVILALFVIVWLLQQLRKAGIDISI